MPVDPFDFDLPTSLLGRAGAVAARPLLSRLLGLTELQAAYRALPGGPDETFAERVLEALAIDIDVATETLERIPTQGPLIIAANHPRGALDGLVLASLVRRIRADARLLANYLLSRIPEMRSACFFVDPFDGASAEARSLAGLRAAHVWLRRGGALIMFPAGEVAPDLDEGGTPIERRWSTSFGRLASATRAAIVPVFIGGTNSARFYAAGRVHPRLRTALLPRELLSARHSSVQVHIGAVLNAEGDAKALTKQGQEAAAAAARPVLTPAEEIARLEADARLLQSGQFGVFCTAASAIPGTIREIGRLRAVSYRAAGEGTGSDADLDDFDRHYLHLFVWDRDRQQVVGAYRLGRSDLIVRERGVEGLYTRTLFNYGRELIDAMSPALELGRSFVRPEYQRNHMALLLLWRGIGEFVVRHAEYRMLFGPVSISASYDESSQTLLSTFLAQNHLDASLARMVTPLHPHPSAAGETEVPSTMGELDRLVSQQEPDGKGVPVLLRQYLQLGARALSFSVDPAFGHVLDALVTVDLTSVRPSLLRRYLGDDGAKRYLELHTRPSLSPAA